MAGHNGGDCTQSLLAVTACTGSVKDRGGEKPQHGEGCVQTIPPQLESDWQLMTSRRGR